MSHEQAANDPLLASIVSPPRGRRSEQIHSRVLEATASLLREGGYGAATMDAIAERAEVSKVTLYNHWPSRTAVAAKAFGVVMADEVSLPDTGSPVGDLTELVRRVSTFYTSEMGQVPAQLVAACVDDPAGAAYFREYFLSGRRAAVGELWERVVARGEALPGVAVDDVIDTLFGPLLFRLLIRHHPITDDGAVSLVRIALRGVVRPSAFAESPLSEEGNSPSNPSE